MTGRTFGMMPTKVSSLLSCCLSRYPLRTQHATDTLARLSVYTVPNSSPSYSGLLPHFVPPRASLPHTLVMILLDWTRPWSFVQELETWLKWVEQWVKGDGSRELEIAKEENRERRACHSVSSQHSN